MTFLKGRRPSAAGTVAVAALVCALSGTAVATAAALQNGDKLIAKHTLSGNRLRNHTVTAGQVKQPVWHTMTLLNGWTAFDTVNYGKPAYAIDDQGFLHFRGAISGTAATSDTFAQLPAGFRPTEIYDFVPAASTDSSSNPVPVNLVIQHAGYVSAKGGTSVVLGFVSLAGVSVPTV